MERLILKVITWAEDTNIIKGSDLRDETLKLTSEYGDLINYLGQKADCRDNIGKCLIGMIIICRMRNISLNDCLLNIEEITDRRIVNSKFVIMTAAQYLGKLNKNILKYEDVKFNIGYLFIYLAALTRILNYSLEECIETAYGNLIKKKGIIFDGNFIEETEENYQLAVSILKPKKEY